MRFGLGARNGYRDRLERRAQLRAAMDDAPAEPAREQLPAILPPLGPKQRRPSDAFPDLLHPEPMVSLDEAPLLAALRFSFIAEDDSGAVEAALDRAALAPSRFEPACCFRELFVGELLESSMRVHFQGKPVRIHQRFVARVLSQPPDDPRATLQRAAVLAELMAAPTLRASVARLHADLHALFKQLRGEGSLGIRGEHARRRIEILKRIHELIEALAGDELASARSALSRLASYAKDVRASEGFALLHDLITYERERAYADLTVQLGADGTVRALAIQHLRERPSRFHTSLLSRTLGQVVLWLKGYRITEGEVLDRWVDQVFDGVAHCLPVLVQLMGDLDVVHAGLAFDEACAERRLPTCFAELSDDAGAGTFVDLYNPLLFASGIVPVCCDVQVAACGVTTLITGPNSGGKTRLLQALGLAQLLAQGGFPVPARSARIRRVPGIFASLTQESRAEQPEGRLGTELLRIRMLFERAELGSLLLVDELCSGTSPSEGEELFRLVLEIIAELLASSFVSTHFLAFAAQLAHGDSGLALACLQVELDADERPTHKFVHGVATTSLAHKTAARLGVTRDELRALLAQKTRPRQAHPA
jgi:DNA mismatch repair protein MutS2